MLRVLRLPLCVMSVPTVSTQSTHAECSAYPMWVLSVPAARADCHAFPFAFLDSQGAPREALKVEPTKYALPFLSPIDALGAKYC